MKIYNSLARKIEEFIPMNAPTVTMYTCGPTVYDYPTIGNWRTYTFSDLLFRTLVYLGYKVKFTMNLTDVGHLTGDNLGDADTGEDRLEKAAARERKTAWDIANFYAIDFVKSFELLNLWRPIIFSRATEHIPEQIELIKKIEAAGFAYKIDDGVYFDVAAYEKAGNHYGELSDLDVRKEGARVEVNPQKKDPRDFALWKFSPTDKKRDMEWESPWGVGFPGWHVECSAMSMKYLGEQLDIHVGGEDLKSTHHPNEIAQSEAATGKKPFVKYWVHGAFLTVDGGRMGKSRGNAYALADLAEKGFDPLALRYFYLTGHYRKQINFTWEGLAAAASALAKLRQLCEFWRQSSAENRLTEGQSEEVEAYKNRFKAAIEDDLNMPEALAVLWGVSRMNIPEYSKYELTVNMDQVLGLGLENFEMVVSDEAEALLAKREDLRKAGKFEEADKVREQLETMGYQIEDTPEGTRIVEK